MKVGILFDLDGTLLNTLGDIHAAVNYTLTHFGYPTRTIEEIRTFVGNGLRLLMKRALPEGVSEAQWNEACSFYQAYYDSHSTVLTCPYDGVLDALKALRDFPIGVVSNKQDTAVKPLCSAYFGDEVFALGECPGCPRKPAPDMIFRAMQALGVEKAVFVGDSEVDVQVGKNAGLPCLSVTWGFRSREELEKAGGKHFCDAPEKLAETLKEMVNTYYGK